MMLLHLFLHVLIYHLLSAKEGAKEATKENGKEQQREQQQAAKPKDTNYIIKHKEQCPAVGYYFTRAPEPNSIDPGPCYLCFCQGDQTAVCWKRDNRRCNVESFHYHGVGKRQARIAQNEAKEDTRVRRSPGFADIFFRDATRDVFDMNGERECKPFESSFSDDCPPADWCIGCTVCDCDANGRWDCHVLSFCPDMKKNKGKGGKGSSRKVVKKKPVPKSTSTPRRKSHNFKRNNPPNTRMSNKRKSPPPRPKRIAKKFISRPKPKPQKKKTPLRFRKGAPKVNPRKPKNSKKKIASRKSIQPKRNNKPVDKNQKNKTVVLAQQVVKKVMAAVKKMVQKEFNNFTKLVAHNNNAARNNKINPKDKNKKQNNKQLQNKMRNAMRMQGRAKRALKPADTKTSASGSATMTMHEDTPIDSTPEAYTLTPINSNLLSSTVVSFTFIPVVTSTHNKKEYYKYIVATEKARPLESKPVTGVNKADVSSNNKTGNSIANAEITVTNENKTNIVKKSIDGSSKAASSNVTNGIGLKNISDKYKYLTDIHHEENNFNKWSQLKVKNVNEIKSDQKSMNLVKSIVNETESHISQVPVSKKTYNIIKILSRNKCPFLNNVSLNNESAPSDKTKDLQDILVKLFKDYNNSTKRPKKMRKFSVVKYLKKMFNKLFKRKNNSRSLRKNHVIESLCESYGPCIVKIKDKPLLKSKLADLDHETTTILKTVNIIKGLLKLLHMPLHYKSLHNQDFFQSDIHRLDSILKGNYEIISQQPLTDTQLIQIEYIKKNTQYFVESVGKFTTLLNQIISILTRKDITRDTIGNKHVVPHLTKIDPFQTLKYLLQKYNLKQNNLMREMYEAINNFENNTHDKSKVSPAVGQDLNSSIEIENFSRNIIENLRNLTQLPQTLNYSSRSKRETRDDDALQYLLMLMEFLLKKNRPLDATPVNDGIDLLIEAIKNAPDIKTVRKKVLDNTSSTGHDTHSTTTMTIFRQYSTVQKAPNSEDSPSYSGSIFNEDTAKFLEMVEDDKDSEDRFQFDRRAKAFPELLDVTTDLPRFNKIHFDALVKSINHVDNVVDTTSQSNTGTEYKGDIISSVLDNSNTYDENVNQGEKEKNNSPSDKFLDTAGMSNNFDDNTENSNTDLGKNNTISNTFGVNARNSHNFDESAENGNIENVKNNIIGNIFNYNTANVNNYDDNIENEHIDSVKNNNNVNTLIDNIENGNIPEIISTSKPVTEETTTVTMKDSNSGEKINATNIEAEFDEEGPLAVSVVESDMPSTTTEFLQWRSQVKTKTKKFKMLDPDNIDQKTKLEWIVENFGSEDKNIEEHKSPEEKNENIHRNTTNIPPVTVESHSEVKPTPILKTDISSISNEVPEETTKKRKKKINAEEVMLKKQMSLLNSLDYGTEKGEFEESNLKDGIVDERNSENVSAYFV